MPVEFGLWRLGDKPIPVSFSSTETENRLESYIANDLSIIDAGLMLVGRQVVTAFNKRIDLLAIDEEGDLVIIELKRDRTPRDVVAQGLDYASWVRTLSYEDIERIYAEQHGGEALEAGYGHAFHATPPEELNRGHRILVVSTDLDPSTERIIGYLAEEHGVPINVAFFRLFQDGDRQYLARTWLISPDEAEANSHARKSERQPWNGQDFYASIGVGEDRSWADMVEYGFISGGGGRWYSNTLGMLFTGARVFACIPSKGYVGVATVTEAVKPVTEFMVPVNGDRVPVLDAPLKAPDMGRNAADPESCEYLVRVAWQVSLPVSDAFWVTGMYANQNTVTRMRSRFTIEKMIEHFGIGE